MLAEELLLELHNLTRIEKLHVVQLLVNDLAQEEEDLLIAGRQYEVWSPFDASGAAETLTGMLKEDAETFDG